MKKLINSICTRKVSFRALLEIQILYEVISTWMFSKYLKLNLFKTGLLIIFHLVPPEVFPSPLTETLIFQMFRPKTSVILELFHLLTPLTQCIRKVSFLYFQNRSKITRFTATTLIQVSHHYLSPFLHSLYLLHGLCCNSLS